MEIEHTCPYCAHDQWSEVDTSTQRSKEMIECGACSKRYLVVFTLKIEHEVSEIPGGREYE